MSTQRLLVVALALLVFVAAGCGDSSDPSSDDVAAGADGSIDSTADVVSQDTALPDTAEDVFIPSDGNCADAPAPLDTEPTDAPSETTLDTAEEIIEPPEMPVALCGMPSYELLPREEVGALLEFEKDTFYDMTATDLTTILSATAGDLMDLMPILYGVRVYRFSYTTQDKGQSVQASSFIAFPANENITEGQTFPVVLTLHGTTGYADSCAPTHPDNFMEGPAYAAILASQGYITVAPDYIGMNGFGDPATTTHGYTVGEQLAIGVWDALRASEELMDDPALADEVDPDGSFAIWGASQGGHAALFTELYGPYYAPEYTLTAVVSVVPPIVMKPLAIMGVESSCPPSVGLAAILVTNRAWYGAPDDLGTVFTNDDPYYFADNLEENLFFDGPCGGQPVVPPGDFDLASMYLDSFKELVLAEDWDALEPYTCYLEESGIVDSSVPHISDTPTLIVFSEDDTLVVTEPMREGFGQLCDKGYQLQYLECADAGHTAGGLWSLPEQLDWLDARLAGEPMAPDKVCVLTDPVCCSATPAGTCEAEEPVDEP